MSGRGQQGNVFCERHTCVNGKAYPAKRWGVNKYLTRCKGGTNPIKGVCNKAYCDKVYPQVCSKQIVVHPEEMSRSAGILIVKRSSCFKGKCSVFKSGLCIDLRRNVWSSGFNEHRFTRAIVEAKGGMRHQRFYFARFATALLKKYNNKLPARHLCVDGRHLFMYQRKHKYGNKWLCYGPSGKCKTRHQDATIARLTILNF